MTELAVGATAGTVAEGGARFVTLAAGGLAEVADGET